MRTSFQQLKSPFSLKDNITSLKTLNLNVFRSTVTILKLEIVGGCFKDYLFILNLSFVISACFLCFVLFFLLSCKFPSASVGPHISIHLHSGGLYFDRMSICKSSDSESGLMHF